MLDTFKLFKRTDIFFLTELDFKILDHLDGKFQLRILHIVECHHFEPFISTC